MYNKFKETVMKRIIMTLAAAVLISSTVLAQEKNDNRKQEMIKHRTERTVKEYNLNDKQAKELLELNTKYADMMRPMHRHGGPGHHGMRGQRPEPPKDMNGEKPEPPKRDMKEMREKMEKDMPCVRSTVGWGWWMRRPPGASIRRRFRAAAGWPSIWRCWRSP